MTKSLDYLIPGVPAMVGTPFGPFDAVEVLDHFDCVPMLALARAGEVDYLVQCCDYGRFQIENPHPHDGAPSHVDAYRDADVELRAPSYHVDVVVPVSADETAALRLGDVDHGAYLKLLKSVYAPAKSGCWLVMSAYAAHSQSWATVGLRAATSAFLNGMYAHVE